MRERVFLYPGPRESVRRGGMCDASTHVSYPRSLRPDELSASQSAPPPPTHPDLPIAHLPEEKQ
jgi:hypothetical protein